MSLANESGRNANGNQLTGFIAKEKPTHAPHAYWTNYDTQRRRGTENIQSVSRCLCASACR